MATAVRLVASLAAALFASAPAVAQPTAPPPHPVLADVAKEYKRLGLPLPPAHAELVRINRDRYSAFHPEDLPEERYDVAYRVPAAKSGGRVRYWEVEYRGVGLREREYVEPAAVEGAESTSDVMRAVAFRDGDYLLAFAVQCQERGRFDLATRLYAQAREEFGEDEKPLTVFENLHLIAWVYWRKQTTERGTDRAQDLRRLLELAEEDPSLRTPSNDRFLRRLERTVAPRKSKPGTVEALIDELTEYWDDPLGFPQKPAERASYWKLAELGFDAVPALIEHLGDDRLTRTYIPGALPFGGDDLTVGHLCSQLLFDLSARTIGGKYSELVDDRLDPVEVRKWFEKAKQVGEEKWLLDHALPSDTSKAIVYDRGRAVIFGKAFENPSYFEPHFVRAIGAKYPARLATVYRAMLKTSVAGGLFNDFVTEIVASKLPREQTCALLEEGAASDDLDHRLFALKGLARLDRALLRKHLRATLNRIWLLAWLGHSDVQGAYEFARLTEAADDRACWDALALVTKNVSVESRMKLIWGIEPEGPPDRKDPRRLHRIRFLVQFLGDRIVEVDEEGTRTEVRDYAATQLAGVLGFTMKRREFNYTPVHDGSRGVFSRSYFRAAVWEAAVRELDEK
ncbi:hypothetical protein [Frigoriglobus tundricola]|uniref:Uncharacterized protein n=1 Tax=Frigoriglobus tundricola TaxID=2774151 RepID=A0A6M5YJ73_9BACT|nr:hypothetical protein [Frigoriglobus tundricola]QJW93326.1 hypothetical protein FTUN_0832 [Frigoriglobus tundricola]